MLYGTIIVGNHGNELLGHHCFGGSTGNTDVMRSIFVVSIKLLILMNKITSNILVVIFIIVFAV